MKKLCYSFAVWLSMASLLCAQNPQTCNYITSGYYQLAYEADIAYLEGKRDLAFEKLQEAEQRCELINRINYKEIERYTILLFERGDYPKAIYYLEKLATDYGQQPYFILLEIQKNADLERNLFKAYPAFYDSVLEVIVPKCDNFYNLKRDSLVAELNAMFEKDQLLRRNWRELLKSPDSTMYRQQFQHIDEENKKGIKAFIARNGFPNFRLWGFRDFENLVSESRLEVMLMHFCEDMDIQQIVLKNIENGQCPPITFGSVIDRCLLNEGRSLYAIYSDVKEEEIIDILNLDNRRVAIGMPTVAMEKRREELVNAAP